MGEPLEDLAAALPKPPGLLLRFLRSDHPERISALVLLLAVLGLVGALIVLAVAHLKGRDSAAAIASVCLCLSGVVGYAYRKGKEAETAGKGAQP